MPSSPTSPGRATKLASPEKMFSSTETTSTCSVAMSQLLCCGGAPSLHLLGLLERFLDRADHIEGLLGKRIALAAGDHLEAADRLLERDVLARAAGEDLGDVERLAEEALDLARTRDRELVLGRELVHAEDRDDVAQLLVALQRALHRAGDVVVLLADDVR